MKKQFGLVIIFCLLFATNTYLSFGENLEDWNFDEWETDEENSLDEIDVEGSEIMGTVHMQEEFLTNDLFKISVLAEDLASPVLGAAFHLSYDPSQVAFLKYEPGDFLEKGGGDPFYLVKDAGAKLIFGQTLRKEDSFPLGNGRLVDFYFQVLAKDKFAFKFSNGVISSLDTIRQDLDHIEWKDLLLDSTNTSQLQGAFNTDGSNLKTNSLNDLSFSPMLAALIIGAVLVAGSLIFFLRKQEKKKRHVICQF